MSSESGKCLFLIHGSQIYCSRCWITPALNKSAPSKRYFPPVNRYLSAEQQMESPGSAEQSLSWWKKGAISFQGVFAFIEVAKENQGNITAGLRFSDLEHSPEAEGGLSQKPPAALSPLIMVGLSSSLDQPISTTSIILTCPLFVLTHIWASPCQDPAVHPCNLPDPRKLALKSVCCPLQLPNHSLSCQRKQLSPT